MPCVDAWADSEDESADAREAGDDAQTCEHITDAEVERRKHHNAGYLDGLEIGKAETVQSGFNAGFLEGGRAGFDYGQARGAALSLRVFADRAGGSPSWSSAVETSEERFKGMTTVRALKAAHAESVIEHEGSQNFTTAVSALRRDIEATGVALQEFPK